MKTHKQNLQEHFTKSEKLGSWITDHVGTMYFFYLIFGWTAAWLLWNSLAPHSLRFDPAPDFLMWLFISNLIQILLMPLIMIGQNIQNRRSELLAENDFKTDKEAALEIQRLHQKIDLLMEKLEKKDQ